MSYESAPATRLLATHCSICGRPLLDAESVRRGIGPVCAEQMGLEDEGNPNRDAANRLIYRIALVHLDDQMEALRLALSLEGLGYPRIGAHLARRLATVRIEEDGDELLVYTPFRDDLVAMFQGVPGRRWDAEAKANRVPKRSRAVLWRALKFTAGGELGWGPRGPFVIA